MTDKRIRVAIVDDHPVAREGLRAMLAKIEFVKLVGEGENGVDGIRLARTIAPDILIADIEMPRVNGVEVVRTLKAEGSPVRVIAISGYDNREYVYGVLRSGAAGFLMKEEATRSVLEAVILSVMRTDAQWVSPELARRLVHAQMSLADRRNETAADALDNVTEREVEILRYIAHGWSNEEVADKLNIAPVTVRNHENHLRSKLDLHTRAELAVWAWERKLVSAEDGIEGKV